jgi:cyclic pyranopterin phosphate synthase
MKNGTIEIFEKFEEIKEKIKKAKEKNIKRIKISGGEPTLHPNIFEIIRFIREEGLDVKLNTNARVFSYPSFCKKMYNTGLRTISVSIWSDKPKIHDDITKVQKSLEQAVNGINNWKKLGGQVEVRSVLFKENKEDISNFIDFILELETNVRI